MKASGVSANTQAAVRQFNEADWLSVSEVARRTGFNAQTLYRWIAAGVIDPQYVHQPGGPGTQIRLHAQVLTSLLPETDL